MEAAKETGVNGMGMGQDGKLTHITAMMSIRLTNQLQGCYSSGGDLLGSTVASALSVAKQALYDREHPLEPISTRSLEVQKQIEKEMEFWRRLLGDSNRRLSVFMGYSLYIFCVKTSSKNIYIYGK